MTDVTLLSKIQGIQVMYTHSAAITCRQTQVGYTFSWHRCIGYTLTL